MGRGKNCKYEITPGPVSGGNLVRIFASTKFLCAYLFSYKKWTLPATPTYPTLTKKILFKFG